MDVVTLESQKVDTEWKWLQPISQELFQEKYMLQNEETVEEVFRGVAKEISSVENPVIREEIEEMFYNVMKTGEFIPGGRILSNARPDSPIKNYNNCFTIAVEDSMDGIFDALKEDAMISKVGGGVGFDISPVRPKGSTLTKGGEASGPISFLKIFNQSAKTIKTGGFRRPAHIALMDISHPDIKEFITVKQGDRNKELSNFNLSVKITDKFVHAYKNDEDWDLVFDGKIYETIKARELYDLITKDANGNIDSFEQTLIYDSFPFNIKLKFQDSMEKTMQYTEELNSSIAAPKVSYENQIALMKCNDQVKEKAIQKLKEIKGKNDDSFLKAKNYLEGLLRIPFGIIRTEPILQVALELKKEIILFKETNQFPDISSDNLVDLMIYCKSNFEIIYLTDMSISNFS